MANTYISFIGSMLDQEQRKELEEKFDAAIKKFWESQKELDRLIGHISRIDWDATDLKFTMIY